MISYIRGEILYCTDSSVVVDVGSVGMEVNVTTQTLAAMEFASGPVEFYTYLHVKEDALTLYGFSSRNELKLFKMLITVSGIGPKSALGILSQISVENLIAAIISEDSATIAKTPGLGAKSAGKIVLELKDKLTFEDMLKVGNTEGMLHGSTGIRRNAAGSGKSADGSGVSDDDRNADGLPGVAAGVDGKSAAGAGQDEKGSGRKRAGGRKAGNANDQADASGGKAGSSGAFAADAAMEEKLRLQENKNEAIQALAALGYSISDSMKAVRNIELEPGMTTEDILRMSLKYL
ncbi:MAG: Holliday junction branch migration protein RuvA [Lachnospiraceae bacterium]|nr:Holliday junction branch migration protein RuvA [Lachnospiraceae bacterium]